MYFHSKRDPHVYSPICVSIVHRDSNKVIFVCRHQAHTEFKRNKKDIRGLTEILETFDTLVLNAGFEDFVDIPIQFESIQHNLSGGFEPGQFIIEFKILNKE